MSSAGELPRRSARHRLRGQITSAGFESGDRIVVGAWHEGPLGPMNDVMWARPDGRRILLAPSAAVVDFISTIYRFDDTEVVAVKVDLVASDLVVTAGGLRLTARGGRSWPIPLGRLRTPTVTRYVEGPIARAVMGVHTFGVSASGVHEWYQADRYQVLTAAAATCDGHELGTMGRSTHHSGSGSVSLPVVRPWSRSVPCCGTPPADSTR